MFSENKGVIEINNILTQIIQNNIPYMVIRKRNKIINRIMPLDYFEKLISKINNDKDGLEESDLYNSKLYKLLCSIYIDKFEFPNIYINSYYINYFDVFYGKYTEWKCNNFDNNEFFAIDNILNKFFKEGYNDLIIIRLRNTIIKQK